jgi:hypothetical protein
VPCHGGLVPRARSAAAAAALAVVLAGCGGEPAPRVAAARQAAALEVPAPAPSTAPPVPVVQRGHGRLEVVPGTSARTGAGELTTYVVEVEGGLGIEASGFAAAVEGTLADPRSWTARRAMQRVDDEDDADLRVVLASPALTDQLCAPLDTGGYFSCANGATAVLNAARWLRGAPSYDGHLEDYRSYVVNHEVGHTLGLGHADCPGAGQVAPVMLQQTKGLDGCARGPWPYP